MNIKILNELAPRFRTKEDGLRYMESVKERKPVPPEIWVWPFIEKDGKIWPNPEYIDAPFEARVL